MDIKATVTRTVEVEMRPHHAFLYFNENGSGNRVCRVQYAEYHDGVFVRALALQDAPAEKAGPVLAAVEAAMEQAAEEALVSATAKKPDERDENEAYLAALMEAGQ